MKNRKLSCVLAIFLPLLCLFYMLSGEDFSFPLSKPQCDGLDIGMNWTCLRELLQKIYRTKGEVVILQANFYFAELVMNVVCSGLKAGLPKESFLIWSLDEDTHQRMMKEGINSFYNRLIFYGDAGGYDYHSPIYNRMMRQRALFWKVVHDAGVPFWWIDADVVIHQPLHLLLREFSNTDVIFQMDSYHVVDPSLAHRKYCLKEDVDTFVEGCGGFIYFNSTLGSMIFLEMVDGLLYDNHEIEDQQAINQALKSEMAFYTGVDGGNTSYLGNAANASYLGGSTFNFDFFRQESVPSGHFLKQMDNRFDMRANGVIVASHLNGFISSQKKIILTDEKLWFLNADFLCR